MAESAEIFPPCGVRLGDKEPEFICNAIVLEGNIPGNLIIDSIIAWHCDEMVEEGSCPREYKRINGKLVSHSRPQ